METVLPVHCKNCLYWLPEDRHGVRGDCRRYPPKSDHEWPTRAPIRGAGKVAITIGETT